MRICRKETLCDHSGKPFLGLAIFLVVGCLSPTLNATITQVLLKSSPAPPQLLGTTLHLTASATDSDPGPLTYKWEVQNPQGSSFALMRDFDVQNTFDFTPNAVEGIYQLRITARDYLAGTSAQRVVKFQIQPLVTGGQPVVVATANPLVALFSAPTCPAGSTMRVVFAPQGSPTNSSATDWRACHPNSMNFYIGGMPTSMTYLMAYQVNTGGKVVQSPQTLSFTAGPIPSTLKFPVMSIPVPAAPQADTSSGIVLAGYASPPYFPTAYDLTGNIEWYYSLTPPTQLTRVVPGGTMLLIAGGLGTGTGPWGPNVTRQQILREVDLAGNTVRETNSDRISEQLVAMGTDPIGRFNHDAFRVASANPNMNGTTIVLADVQRIFPAGTQGSTVPVDIVAALIAILDQNFQVIGFWNAFDHDCTANTCLSIERPAVRGETCVVNSKGQTQSGCPPVLLLPTANDWLHSNSIEYLPSDGDLLMSARDQDWVVKIDYNDGRGTGNILWRLGNQGDFAIPNCPPPYTSPSCVGAPYPWFSAQHDAGFVNTPTPEQTFTVYDNGVSRHTMFGGNSRGQVWTIDQTNMLATLETNADLGAYSFSLGSAQQMLNGNYAFLSGNIAKAGTIEIQSTEVPPAGAPFLYQFQALGSVGYRGYRLADFYNVQPNGFNGPE